MEKHDKLNIIAGLYGNALEWYDFMLYASFAPLFAKIYFPTNTYFISLLTTFAVFSIGFFMRPLGGALLGHYADYAGRRKALIVAIVTMTLATAIIAALPGFYSIGLISPVLFVLFRLIQSIAIGGELPGTTTFLIEHTKSNRRGFIGSLVLSTAFLGIFFGALVAAILSKVMTAEDLLQWGWRMAYLFGAVLGVMGIYLRFKSKETNEFLKNEKSSALPAKVVITVYKYKLLMAIIFTGVMASSNYAIIAFITNFLLRTEHLLLSDVLTINFISLLTLTALIPVAGILSDYFGVISVFLCGIFSLPTLIFPIFYLLSRGSLAYALYGELLLVLAIAPINATLPTILASMFPTAIRASGVSIGYNIGQAVFGGTLPLIALTLVEYTGNKFAPAWYLFVLALVAIIAALYLQKEEH